MDKEFGTRATVFVAGLAAGIIVVLVVLLTAPPFSHYCEARETPQVCFREWASMLSGWAAFLGGLVAAYLAYRTITRMNAQIVDADRHQRENLELELGSRFALASQAELNCREVIKYLDYASEASWGNSIMSSLKPTYVTAASLSYEGDLVGRFAATIGTTEVDAAERIRNHIDSASNDLGENFKTDGLMHKPGEDDEAYRRRMVTHHIDKAREFAVGVETDARTFIDRWKSRIRS